MARAWSARMRTVGPSTLTCVFFSQSSCEAHAQAPRWKMAGKLEPLNVESPEAAEEAEGQAKSSKKAEDLLAMVIKLQKEGSLEPQIEDLINRINEIQQEALRILQLQEKKSEAQRLDVEEQLEDLMGQHKDLWEFHVLERRLAREIRALERSKEQLLAERKLVGAKLQDVERRLRSLPEVEGVRAGKDGLKAGLGKCGEQVQGASEAGAGQGEARPELLCADDKEDLDPPPAGPDAP
ncbi:synaptonemal complex central element protein 1-like isoform X2 [Eulemur rufifrons]|uniref:synaptonemal complex central element protein 1-like isoform X2 n=1 Tax=Eulemur rufifrons TaxID=859984 RepID=UPI003743D7FA